MSCGILLTRQPQVFRTFCEEMNNYRSINNNNNNNYDNVYGAVIMT